MSQKLGVRNRLLGTDRSITPNIEPIDEEEKKRIVLGLVRKIMGCGTNTDKFLLFQTPSTTEGARRKK